MGGTDGVATAAAADNRTEGDAESDDESSPAEDFGVRLGAVLALVAIAWAFVGPAHLLEVGRYELPILASFVDPVPLRFFGYVAGVTFALALAGGVAFPSVSDEQQEGYGPDLAIGLIVPTVLGVVLMVVLGYLFPALFYVVSGEFVRAGTIVGGMVVVGVGAYLLRTVVLVAVAVAASPLWVPAFAGAVTGSLLRTTGV